MRLTELFMIFHSLISRFVQFGGEPGLALTFSDS